MKKIGKIAMAVVVLLAVCMMSACGGSGKSNTTKTETIIFSDNEFEVPVINIGDTITADVTNAVISNEGTYGHFYIVNIQKDGMLNVWTEKSVESTEISAQSSIMSFTYIDEINLSEVENYGVLSKPFDTDEKGNAHAISPAQKGKTLLFIISTGNDSSEFKLHTKIDALPKDKEITLIPSYGEHGSPVLATKITIGKDHKHTVSDISETAFATDSPYRSSDYTEAKAFKVIEAMMTSCYVVTVQKPGVLTVWTESDLDTAVAAISYAVDKDGRIIFDSEIELDEESDIDYKGKNYNGRAYGVVQAGKVVILPSLERMRGVTEAKIKAGLVDFTIKTEFKAK